MFACLLSLGPLQAVETEPTPPKPQDLTGLSLEELLHEDITPINVLGSHTHLGGGFMVGYRYSYMDMDHNMSGTKTVSDSEVLAQYPVVHTHMSMEMQMAELMYAPLDSLTLMVMVPYEAKSMDHLTRTGLTFTDETSGLGDIAFMTLINIYGNPGTLGNRVVLNLGFTAPTGSIDEGEDGHRYEYELQLGSGTWDFEPGLTYLGESERWAWGAQVLGTVRFGLNENDYRLGNAYRLGAWAQYKVTDWFGPSIRLDWHAWSDIHGADPELDPNRNPAFNASKQAGERLDFVGGLNFYVPTGFFKGNRLSIEGGVPVYQNIDGPNMAVDWLITVGWSWSFR